MKHLRIRRRDKVTEGEHVVRGVIGTCFVIAAILGAFWVIGNKYLNAAPTPANQTSVSKAVVGGAGK